MEFDTAGISDPFVKLPKGYDIYNNVWMTIVNITGVHHLPVHFCSCPSAPPMFRQLLNMALYPVSHDRPRTAFTFRLLDDFDLDNLETKSSAQRYYAKLIRLTSNAFPQYIPDRYQEFMRVMREWRNIKLQKRAGAFGAEKDKDTKGGGLALFCAACPQPGVNLPKDWEKDENQYDFSLRRH